MQESRLEFQTKKSVQQCANIFQQAVKASYGGGRKLMRGAALLRGSDMGGIEFFTPKSTPFNAMNGSPDFKAGAWIPGLSKWNGASRMAVHIYVVDSGDSREVQLVGPHGVGDRGSTERLLRTIAQAFQ